MTQLIFGHDDELAAWAEAEYPKCAPLSRPLTAIGIADENNNILGVAIYHNFRHNDIELTFIAATPRWATPGNIRALLRYPFIQLGVQRMTAITEKKNKKARRVNEGVGFVLEGVHPYGASDGGTICTYGIYRKQVMERWLKNG